MFLQLQHRHTCVRTHMRMYACAVLIMFLSVLSLQHVTIRQRKQASAVNLGF